MARQRCLLILAILALACATPASVTQKCYGDAADRFPACRRHVFTIHAPLSGPHAASLHCNAASRTSAHTKINGGMISWISLPSFTLQLRRGINTVAVSLEDAGACDLVVQGALQPTVGAQLPYIELEAENATLSPGSVVIGPNYTYYTLPSEASYRMAVQIAPGQFLDFNIPPGAAANAIMIRFSIPDAAAGGGIDTPLLVYMNETQLAANITLTSAYSWQYGSYPFTKNPADGGAHHFYDEVSLWLPSRLTAGSSIRLQNPPSPTAGRRLQSGPNCSVPIPDPSKRDCGFNGINETQCLARNCCWVPINPNPNSYPWCYFPTAPPPPPQPGNITITIDLIDIFDVPAAYPAPPNAVSIVDHGADPSGGSDSSAAIAAAIAAAGATQPVWAPPGNYTVTQHIALPDNLTLVGAGTWYTKFAGSGVGLYGNGAPQASVNVHVSGLSIIGDTRVRNDDVADTGIGGALTDSVVSDVRIEHTKCGCWLDGAFDSLLITGVMIRNTFADGVNFHRGITNSVVEHSYVRNTGDDGLAMWSQTQPDVNNTFQFNTIQTPVLANNIAIYGGSGNSMQYNLVIDTLTEGGGLHVGNRFSSVALAGQTTILGNTAVRCGQFDPGFQFGVGALWFYALDEPLTGAVTVSNNLLQDSQYEAVQFIGSSISNVSFYNLSVVNVGSFVFQIQSSGAATAQAVIASGRQYSGVYNCSEPFQLTDLGGNAGWANAQCGFPPELA